MARHNRKIHSPWKKKAIPCNVDYPVQIARLHTVLLMSKCFSIFTNVLPTAPPPPFEGPRGRELKRTMPDFLRCLFPSFFWKMTTCNSEGPVAGRGWASCRVGGQIWRSRFAERYTMDGIDLNVSTETAVINCFRCGKSIERKPMSGCVGRNNLTAMNSKIIIF